jgi:hypothetical protein
MEILGYITATVLIIVCSIATLTAVASYFRKKQLPKLAGATIPELNEGLDITKRYDIVYSGEYGTSFVERLNAARILGYIGQDDEAVGKMYMRSRWLVVSFPDGRKAYLMPRAILSLQESAEV